MHDVHRAFEAFLVNTCAPMLLGRKPATLLSEKSLPEHCAWSRLRMLGFRVCRLRRGRRSSLMLIYQPRLLSEACMHPIALERLAALGYSAQADDRALLSHLKRRFAESSDFPHEVGFFLGYPPEDVIGFMDCKDACKLCGPWKVYGDEARATALFAEYKRLRAVLLAHIARGGTLFSGNLSALAG